MPISDKIYRRLTSIKMREHDMLLHFDDGGDATAPYWWYPRLQNATKKQRKNWKISGGGRGIHWPDIDEDLSINGILAGAKAPDATAPSEAAE